MNGAGHRKFPLLLELTPAVSQAEFAARLLHFINHVLPRYDRRGKEWPQVFADTPLFASGLLDSLSILHLIAAIEALTGGPVPDDQVLMKHFQTVDTIVATFRLRANPPL